MVVEARSREGLQPVGICHRRRLSQIRARPPPKAKPVKVLQNNVHDLTSLHSLSVPEENGQATASHKSCPNASSSQQDLLNRRQVLQFTAATALVLQYSPESKASVLPEAVDNAWSSLGGGPSDLTFPELFLGTWRVQATLTKVETPLGPEYVPDMKVIDRAKQEDLQHPQKYLVTFMRNKRGQVIIDRRFNTSQLVSMYLNHPVPEDVIAWNPDNPNQLKMNIPGGLSISTRVTRRSQETPAADKLNTSEYFQQIFESPGRPSAKVKASQCYTKYKYRTQEAADRMAGPAIVATQVISDYLTAYDGELLLLKSQNRPVAVYTYSLVFVRPRGLSV